MLDVKFVLLNLKALVLISLAYTKRVMGIEPTCPAWKAGALPLSYTRLLIFYHLPMGGAGFEPAKAVPPDLQSGPFSHLGIHPTIQLVRTIRKLAVRLELTTYGLQNRCSTS